MTARRIAVEVDAGGWIQARVVNENAHSPRRPIPNNDLDLRLIRLFQCWLQDRGRRWLPTEIRAFGALLHRALFPVDVWSWILRAADGHELTRITLTFPASPSFARLASVPWEFLYVPDKEFEQGWFLAGQPKITLSRYIQSSCGMPDLDTISQPRLLAIVSQPKSQGAVYADEVLAGIHGIAAANGIEPEVVYSPSATELGEIVSTWQPHMVQFMGHGRYDVDRDEGRLAFVTPDGETDWVPDTTIAKLLVSSGWIPRVVVLHACEGGTTDYAAGFAGVAPQLGRAGVPCVVAMQYPVTNETATRFSTAFYAELARRQPADVAAQTARSAISGVNASLIGVPVVYLRSGEPLLGSPPREDDAPHAGQPRQEGEQ